MSETKRKEKQTNKSLLNIWLLELSEVGIRTPQTSSYDAAYAFLASKSGHVLTSDSMEKRGNGDGISIFSNLVFLIN